MGSERPSPAEFFGRTLDGPRRDTTLGELLRPEVRRLGLEAFLHGLDDGAVEEAPAAHERPEEANCP